jgi:hypothetical protein
MEMQRKGGWRNLCAVICDSEPRLGRLGRCCSHWAYKLLLQHVASFDFASSEAHCNFSSLIAHVATVAMASQTFSRAQTAITGALRAHVIAKSSAANKAVAPQMRLTQAQVFAPQRAVVVRSRKTSSVTAAAGNGASPGGLAIDLRGETVFMQGCWDPFVIVCLR